MSERSGCGCGGEAPAKAEPQARAVCGGGGAPVADDFDYGVAPFVEGEVATVVGPVSRIATTLTLADRLGAWRMRWNIGRGRYRVRPGLYAVGEPDDKAPVLVTASYKLTFDMVRSKLAGRHAWLIVLDTRGVNVWCAAGKGSFGTAELVRRVKEARLEQIVSHRKLIVPQLGATGVAGHDVRAATGFRVVWGPVRAAELPAFLDAGLVATPEMRRVTFSLAERAVLIPVELSFVWRPKVLLAIAAVGAFGGLWRGLTPEGFVRGPGASLVMVLAAFVGGTVVVPLLLPWIPGRAFSLKGAIVGAVTGAVVAYGWYEPLGPFRAVLLTALSAAIASFTAMNFTGSSTYTSPSGVEWEMRRALPFQLGALAAHVIGLFVPWGALTR
jgi:hypothetical protein